MQKKLIDDFITRTLLSQEADKQNIVVSDGEIKKAMSEIEEKGLIYVVTNYSDIKFDLIKEIGDRHWYTTRFLQKLNLSWKIIEQINMEKLKERVQKGMILGKGDNR